MNENDTHLELIRRYLDGTATAEETQTLEALILRDPAMRREFLRYAHLDAALAGNLRPPMIAGVLRSAPQTAQASVKPRSRWLQWHPLAAAAAVLLLAVGWQYLKSDQETGLIVASAEAAVKVERADADGDGRLTKDELRAARKRAGLPAD